MNQKKGAFLILIASLFFGTFGIWSKLIGSSFDVFYQSWTRALIVSLILLPYLLWKKKIVPIHKKDMKWLIWFMSFTILTQAPLFYAYNHA